MGVDGQTAADYAADLEGNLRSLLDRAKSGTLPGAAGAAGAHPEGDRPGDPAHRHPDVRGQGPPTRGRHGPGGRLRAGLPGLLVRLPAGPLGAPGAGRALAPADGGQGRVGPGDRHPKVFRRLDHRHLRAILRRRVRDGVLLRLIGKWLKAGVLEDGCVTHPESGSPQGGVISPLLANVYLHEVLDTWFEQTVKPRLRGGRP